MIQPQVPQSLWDAEIGSLLGEGRKLWARSRNKLIEWGLLGATERGRGTRIRSKLQKDVVRVRICAMWRHNKAGSLTEIFDPAQFPSADFSLEMEVEVSVHIPFLCETSTRKTMGGRKKLSLILMAM